MTTKKLVAIVIKILRRQVSLSGLCTITFLFQQRWSRNGSNGWCWSKLLFVHCVEMCCIAAIATNVDFSLFGYFLPTTVVTAASFHNHLNCSPERNWELSHVSVLLYKCLVQFSIQHRQATKWLRWEMNQSLGGFFYSKLKKECQGYLLFFPFVCVNSNQ